MADEQTVVQNTAMVAVRNLATYIELAKQVVAKIGYGFPIHELDAVKSSGKPMSLTMLTEAVLYALGQLETGKLAAADQVAAFVNANFPTGKIDPKTGLPVLLVTLYVNKADAARSTYYFGGLPMFQTIRDEAQAAVQAAVPNFTINADFRSFRAGRQGNTPNSQNQVNTPVPAGVTEADV